MLFALMTVTPDADGWRPVGMKLLGEIAGLSQPHLREARDELVRAKVLEFDCDGAGHGARHYRWRILVKELYPSGSTAGSGELNPNGQELNPNGQELNPPSRRPAETPPRAFRAFGAKENTTSWDRDESRSRPAIAEEFIEAVAGELCAEMDADAVEYSVITGMLDNGSHPQAIRHTISAGRFGPRATRRSTASHCEAHGMPLAVDGSCGSGCPGVWDAP